MARKKMTLEEIIKKMHETCPEDNEDSTWEECFKYCLMGAELGSGECMANTAFCYEYGNGVEEDQDKAVEWAQKGADAGNDNVNTNPTESNTAPDDGSWAESFLS